MKKNDLQNLKSKSEEDLTTELAKLKKDWLTASSDLAMRKSKNVHEKNVMRKNIARVKTALSELQMQKVAEMIKNAVNETEKETVDNG